jgi:futalosine hydrolase
VKGITVNTVHGNLSSIKNAVKKFRPDIESMEGGAFLFVCKNEGIPCAQVRAISNFVEPRNKKNWNIPLAVENLNRKMIEILEDLR